MSEDCKWQEPNSNTTVLGGHVCDNTDSRSALSSIYVFVFIFLTERIIGCLYSTFFLYSSRYKIQTIMLPPPSLRSNQTHTSHTSVCLLNCVDCIRSVTDQTRPKKKKNHIHTHSLWYNPVVIFLFIICFWVWLSLMCNILTPALQLTDVLIECLHLHTHSLLWLMILTTAILLCATGEQLPSPPANTSDSPLPLPLPYPV